MFYGCFDSYVVAQVEVLPICIAWILFISVLVVEMQSVGSEFTSPISERVQSLSATDTRGKHRILAELKRFEQEAKYLEEELEELENLEKASASCKEMITHVETKPDPLLPETHGPVNSLWDRWFEGLQESKGCRCWIL